MLTTDEIKEVLNLVKLFNVGNIITADDWEKPEQVKFAILNDRDNWQIVTIDRCGRVYVYVQVETTLYQVDTFYGDAIKTWQNARLFDMVVDCQI